MLAGQAINLGGAVIIAITGMCIVMAELAVLAVFIQVMSRVLGSLVKNKEPAGKKAPAAVPTQAAPAAESSEDEDDLAVVMATVLEETDWPMEQVVFRSITRVR